MLSLLRCMAAGFERQHSVVLHDRESKMVASTNRVCRQDAKSLATELANQKRHAAIHRSSHSREVGVRRAAEVLHRTIGSYHCFCTSSDAILPGRGQFSTFTHKNASFVRDTILEGSHGARRKFSYSQFERDSVPWRRSHSIEKSVDESQLRSRLA